ncbi:hypothetical protein [Geomobilimonas luticola]|uniref:Uncharacterized protein n=1 Tax=Geomobilimonas luticola TaxID=1114878 RepID=A0ABS5SH77_9BACT|nr:hypothetical protein [Geomobilimonas luticola]MBT0654590.1 hypothetical protein [Geomobilimonas luticola]
MATSRIEYYEIACQQVLEKDHSVFSIQWVVLPEDHTRDVTPEELLHLYLAYIRSFTCTLVTPEVTDTGVEFHLLRSSLSLLKFDLPQYVAIPHGTKATLHISGGFLVQPGQCDRGELDFIVERVAEGVKLTLQLSDFCPLLLGGQKPSLWRKWLYRFTQAYLHKVVTVRFLSRVHKKLVGYTAPVKIVRARLRSGIDT